MNLEESFLSPDVADYVLKNSCPEPTLMSNLRLETSTQTDLGHMICGPIEGQLLNFLVKLHGAKNILEIGTFTGYSALYMASAITGDGKVTTLEIDEHHASIASKYFAQSPFGHKIDLKLGPALESLTQLNGPFDFVFIDADKKGYPQYFEAILPKVKTGSFIVFDNTFWGGNVLKPTDLEAKTIAQLNKSLVNDPRIEVLMLAIRDGITLCRKK